MIGPAILILGSYLAVGPGVDFFLYPKLFAIFVGALLCMRGPRHESPLRPYFPLILGAAFISAAGAGSPPQAFLGLFRSPTAGLLGLAAVWMSYEAGRHRSTDDWRLVAVGAWVCSLLAIIQFHPAAPYHGLLPGEPARAIGLIGSPPYLGCMLALAVPVAAIRAPGGLLLIIPALLATRSKAAVLGGIIGLYVLFVQRLDMSGRKMGAFLVAACFVVTALMFSRGDSDAMRIQTWQIAWAAFLERPWIGWGPDNLIDAFMKLRTPTWTEAAGHGGMTVAENAHNLGLHILATRGLLGAAASVAFAVAAARGLLNQAPESIWNHEERNILLACTAAVLAYSMFNPVPFMAWCVLAFMLGSLGL